MKKAVERALETSKRLMEMLNRKNKIMIGVYTHKCKAYCDAEFYEALLKAAPFENICILDNTDDEGEYLERLKEILDGNAYAGKYNTRRMPNFKEQFLQNVAETANALRDLFLSSKCEYLLIVESDVIVPIDFINDFRRGIKLANKLDKPLGILGGLYYDGLHDPFLSDKNSTGLIESDSVFSGCTIYSRELMEKIGFTWNSKDMRLFPDSWMAKDAREAGFGLYHMHDIKCKHLRGGWDGNGYK